MFEHPEQEFKDGIIGQLRDYWGCIDYSSMVMSCNEKTWLVKSLPNDPESKNRELLAFLLGGYWLNIPEVRLLSAEEFQELRQKLVGLDENASEQNTYLVRLVQDYRETDLPVQDLDSSMASEIAFSCWILRRDAHASNRAFVQGIPMFFDFHISFGVEAEGFFRGGPDAGYVENWRLWQIESDNMLCDIELLRRLELDKKTAAIPFVNKSHFEATLSRVTGFIRDLDQKYLFETIKKAGFSEERCLQINRILQESSANIDSSIDRVLSIINNGIELLGQGL
jgi:hypothetical protein